jgi:hypothetical protein
MSARCATSHADGGCMPVGFDGSTAAACKLAGYAQAEEEPAVLDCVGVVEPTAMVVVFVGGSGRWWVHGFVVQQERAGDEAATCCMRSHFT